MSIFSTSSFYIHLELDKNKNTEPEIFQILNQRNNWSKKQLKQLLAYAQKLNELSSDK